MEVWEPWEELQAQCRCQAEVALLELHHQARERELQELQVPVDSEAWAVWVEWAALEAWTHK